MGRIKRMETTNTDISWKSFAVKENRKMGDNWTRKVD